MSILNKHNRPIHIALDIDKTLAYHESSWGISRVGDPIFPMVNKVHDWIKKDYKITLFSVRFSFPSPVLEEQYDMVDRFLERAGLPIFPKTACKNKEFTHYVDDRSFHVLPNKGEILGPIDI